MIKDPQRLASNKHGRGFDLEATEKQIQLAVIAGLEPGNPGMQDQRTDQSNTTSASVCFGFVFYLLILINCTVCGAITSSRHTTAACWRGCTPYGGDRLFPVNRKLSSVAVIAVEPALTGRHLSYADNFSGSTSSSFLEIPLYQH